MTKDWYAMVLGNEFGPMSAEELRSMVHAKRLAPDDKVRRGPGGNWSFAMDVKGLFHGETTAVATIPAKLVPQEPPSQVAVAAQTRECPFCAEVILAGAKKCKHCGETIDLAMRAAEESQRAASRQGSGQVLVQQTMHASFNQKRPFPHILHLFITIITMGLWLPIWFFLFLFRSRERYF